jgi:hypothetical protein
MEDLELLVTNACHRSDEVTFTCRGEDEWQASQREPACSRGNRWRVSKVEFVRGWPVVWFRAKCHAKEVDGSSRSEGQYTQGSSCPV